MGAPSFSFKQFTVFHDQCAMKVGTDGVLLGAWADVTCVGSILDIGTGSALIALMLAQRSSAHITAIDIDKDAVNQAILNVENSPWTSRIDVFESSLSHFCSKTIQKFDLIVSNPPYFKNALKTPSELRTIARHAEADFHNQLILSAHKLLQNEGKLCLILPLVEGEQCYEYALSQGLYCSKYVQVFPKPNAEPKRLLMEFRLLSCECVHTELVIESEIRHQYSSQFSEMLQDFYLKL